MSAMSTPVQPLALRIEGMSCAHCVRAVRDALAEVPGTTIERVDIGGAMLSFDPAQTSPAEIADAVRDAGYEPVNA